jgi:hypothetical protein
MLSRMSGTPLNLSPQEESAMLERASTGRLALVLTLVGTLAACSSTTTELTNVWRDPTVSSIHFNKVLVVCMSRDQGFRRTVEDRIVSDISNGVASYTILSEEELRDRDRAKAKVKELGFDGAVITRVAQVEKEQQYMPGTVYATPGPYSPMWGYWGYGWGTAYSPGYVVETQHVQVTTNVYSVKDEKLVWASRSKTTDPSSVTNLVDEVVDANATAMEKEGLLSKKGG